ncbi:hypothetical protein Trydic_g6183 [Trypoxylus dichotomus]
MMRAAEMKTLRTIKRVSLRDRIRSKVIREDLEIQDSIRFARIQNPRAEEVPTQEMDPLTNAIYTDRIRNKAERTSTCVAGNTVSMSCDKEMYYRDTDLREILGWSRLSTVGWKNSAMDANFPCKGSSEESKPNVIDLIKEEPQQIWNGRSGLG